MNPIAITIVALAVMITVRLAVALATRDRAARWLCVPLAWGALAVVGAMAGGCVEDDDGGQHDAAGEEPDASGVDIDAAAPPDAAPDAAPDASPPGLVEASLTLGVSAEHSYATIAAHYNCPDGAPNGPHPVTVELYSNLGLVNDSSTSWSCDFGFVQSSWFNLSCGLTVWATIVTVDPVTGADVEVTTATANTLPCES